MAAKQGAQSRAKTLKAGKQGIKGLTSKQASGVKGGGATAANQAESGPDQSGLREQPHGHHGHRW